MTMMVNLLLASCSKLGYTTPELNLQGYYAPVRVLGLGRNSTVYEAAPTQEGQTAQRYAVKVSETVALEYAFEITQFPGG